MTATGTRTGTTATTGTTITTTTGDGEGTNGKGHERMMEIWAGGQVIGAFVILIWPKAY
jgi:hypothetical protein